MLNTQPGKRPRFSDGTPGFTLIEVVVAVIIIAVASIGLMQGVAYAKAQLNSIALEEKAFEKLRDYTEYYKARVFVAGDTPDQVGGQGDKVILREVEDGPDIMGELFQHTDRMSSGNTIAHYYRLVTRIEWQDPSFGHKTEREMRFITYQLLKPR